MKRTQHLRDLTAQLARVRAEHQRQCNAPSRGYSEEDAFAEMDRLGEEIEAELDRIDAE